jgi:hypothetical protein
MLMLNLTPTLTGQQMLVEHQCRPPECHPRTTKGSGREYPLPPLSTVPVFPQICSQFANPPHAQENYGRKSSTSESLVKDVFSSSNIDLASRFAAYEAESYAKINALIESVDEQGTGMKQEVFRSFLGKVYKRSK